MALMSWVCHLQDNGCHNGDDVTIYELNYTGCNYDDDNNGSDDEVLDFQSNDDYDDNDMAVFMLINKKIILRAKSF